MREAERLNTAQLIRSTVAASLAAMLDKECFLFAGFALFLFELKQIKKKERKNKLVVVIITHVTNNILSKGKSF